VNTTADQSQFRKYLDRVRDIINNKNAKVGQNEVSMASKSLSKLIGLQVVTSQIVRAGVQNRQAFLCLIEDIICFEFEDRKQIQEIVCELL